jgi:surfeit locus 1 family protein
VSAPARLRFWSITAAAVVGLAATGALGLWQLDRGRARDALQDDIDAREQMAPVAQSALLGPDAGQAVHRRVVLRGTWDAAHTVFLDNRQMRGAPVFYVLTPLKLDGARQAVVVQRGWAPRNFEHRDQLPAVATPAGVVELEGRIAPPPARLYEFRGAGAGPIRQNLAIGAFAAETGLALVAVSVQQVAPMASEGLLRDWPRPGSGSATNYGYAFQWWAMSAAIAILYVWFQFIAPSRKPRPAR